MSTRTTSSPPAIESKGTLVPAFATWDADDKLTRIACWRHFDTLTGCQRRTLFALLVGTGRPAWEVAWGASLAWPAALRFPPRFDAAVRAIRADLERARHLTQSQLFEIPAEARRRNVAAAADRGAIAQVLGAGDTFRADRLEALTRHLAVLEETRALQQWEQEYLVTRLVDEPLVLAQREGESPALTMNEVVAAIGIMRTPPR